MPTFSVRVPDAAARRFDAAAAAAGGRSAMLRQLIQDAGGEAAVAGLPTRRPVRLMVRIAVEDGAAVAIEAQAMGMAPATWIAALVRRRLRGRPTFARRDELALLAIRGEVHRIGINVNQIARALNTAVMEGRVLDLEIAALDALRRELRAHLLALREAFEGNLAYWQDDP